MIYPQYNYQLKTWKLQKNWFFFPNKRKMPLILTIEHLFSEKSAKIAAFKTKNKFI